MWLKDLHARLAARAAKREREEAWLEDERCRHKKSDAVAVSGDGDDPSSGRGGDKRSDGHGTDHDDDSTDDDSHDDSDEDWEDVEDQDEGAPQVLQRSSALEKLPNEVLANILSRSHSTADLSALIHASPV